MYKMLLSVSAAVVMIASSQAMAAIAQAGNYRLDKTHTNIGFKVAHMGVSYVVGRFNSFDGSFKFEPNGDSSVSFTIDVNSVDTNNARRDSHLKEDDFFNTARFPRMTFNSTEVTYDVDGNPVTITGDLNMHGVTRSVTLDVNTVGSAPGRRNRIHSGFEATATISRSDFGMDKLLAAAGDEVIILIDIEGITE